MRVCQGGGPWTCVKYVSGAGESVSMCQKGFAPNVAACGASMGQQLTTTTLCTLRSKCAECYQECFPVVDAQI